VQSNEDFIHNCPILHQNRAPLIIKIDQELNLVEIRSEIKDALSIHLSSHALRTDMLKRACVLDNRLTEEVRLSRIILIDGVRIDFVSTIDSDARQVSFQSTANVAIPWFLQLLEEFRDFCAHSACSLSVLWHPHTPARAAPPRPLPPHGAAQNTPRAFIKYALVVGSQQGDSPCPLSCYLSSSASLISRLHATHEKKQHDECASGCADAAEQRSDLGRKTRQKCLCGENEGWEMRATCEHDMRECVYCIDLAEGPYTTNQSICARTQPAGETHREGW